MYRKAIPFVWDSFFFEKISPYDIKSGPRSAGGLSVRRLLMIKIN